MFSVCACFVCGVGWGLGGGGGWHKASVSDCLPLAAQGGGVQKWWGERKAKERNRSYRRWKMRLEGNFWRLQTGSLNPGQEWLMVVCGPTWTAAVMAVRNSFLLVILAFLLRMGQHSA